MDPFIQFHAVKKAFGQKVIYNGLEFAIHRGETVTILGPSGSGKSVMLKMLIGLLEVDSGEILFDGHERRRRGACARRALGQLRHDTSAELGARRENAMESRQRIPRRWHESTKPRDALHRRHASAARTAFEAGSILDRFVFQ